jgi:hypothetical protein
LATNAVLKLLLSATQSHFPYFDQVFARRAIQTDCGVRSFDWSTAERAIAANFVVMKKVTHHD